MDEITQILSQIDRGDAQAAQQLLPLVYEELRKLAASRLATERPGQTLQATALVHEAYLRLVGPGVVKDKEKGRQGDEEKEIAVLPLSPSPCLPVFSSRGHFFAAAAEAMRRILVEQARRKGRVRHGGGLERVELDSQLELAEESETDLVALDDALQRLEQEDPAAAGVVKLRYFGGLTIEEVAQALEISVRTANRHWAYARAWLYQQLS